MNNYPRSYYRAKTALYTLNEFRSLNSHFSDYFSSRQAMLNIIKRSFVSYWKFLKDLLKERGVIKYFPREIIKSAVDNSIIQKDELIWIDYIDLVNDLIYCDNDNKTIAANKIISTYRLKVENIYDFMLKVYPALKNKQKIKKFKLFLDDSKPAYDSSDVGIYDDAYQLLIKFFRSCPEINRVWLHGSRSEGKERSNSDIDLLIDAPYENFDELKVRINRIRIPHRVDATCIYDQDNINFISIVSKHSKIIYRAIDYNYNA